MKLNKWIVNNIDDIDEFSKTTLKIRLNDIEEKVNDYLSESTEEKLHQVRISIRRLRYSIEIFFVHFKQKNYKRFYKKIEELQESTGEIRDLDVIKNIIQNDTIGESINHKREILEKEMVEDLKKFLKSKLYKNFLKIIE